MHCASSQDLEDERSKALHSHGVALERLSTRLSEVQGEHKAEVSGLQRALPFLGRHCKQPQSLDALNFLMSFISDSRPKANWKFSSDCTRTHPKLQTPYPKRSALNHPEGEQQGVREAEG